MPTALTLYSTPPTQNRAKLNQARRAPAHFERSAADRRETPLSSVAETMMVCLRMTLVEGTTAPPWTLVPPAGPDLTARALWSRSSTISLICNLHQVQFMRKQANGGDRKVKERKNVAFDVSFFKL